MASSRRIGWLIGSWVAYWIALAVVGLGPAALAIWGATNAGEGQGSVNVTFGDGRFTLNVAEHGVATYTGSISLTALALWLAAPPLVSWLVWVARRRKSDRTPET